MMASFGGAGCSSSGSGDFDSQGMVFVPPPLQLPPVQGVPQELVDSLRAEAMGHAEQHAQMVSKRCKKQVHLARVRVAELEARVSRSEADCDAMQMQLTVAQVQKAAADEARILAERRLEDAGGSVEEARRVASLEEEVARLREESTELAAMKRTCMVLASELKRRGCVLKEENRPSEEESNESSGSGAEDTDYTDSVCSSRQLSPASDDEC